MTESGLRYTLYPYAPVTADQFTVIDELVDSVGLTRVGATNDCADAIPEEKRERKRVRRIRAWAVLRLAKREIKERYKGESSYRKARLSHLAFSLDVSVLDYRTVALG